MERYRRRARNGATLSWPHSQTQRDWIGTCQSQKTLNRCRDLKKNKEGWGQVLGIGGLICRDWGLVVEQ